MKTGEPAAPGVDAYIAGFPADIRTVLETIRARIRKLVPQGEEKISYQMPAVFLNGKVLVYFATFKSHIGLYPPVQGDASLMQAIAPYAGPKGNLKFPFDKPIPYALIDKVVKARLAAVPGTEKTKAKSRRPPQKRTPPP